MKKIILDVNKEQLQELYDSGKSIKKIATIYKTSPSYMRNLMKANNICFRKASIIPSCLLNVEEVSSAYKSGMPVKEIFKLFNTSGTMFYRFVRKHNLTKRKKQYNLKQS